MKTVKIGSEVFTFSDGFENIQAYIQTLVFNVRFMKRNPNQNTLPLIEKAEAEILRYNLAVFGSAS